MAEPTEPAMGDTQFINECMGRGLTTDDLRKYGCGFEQPGSGKADTRADIVKFNKQAMETLMHNPEALTSLKKALESFATKQT